MGGEIGGRGGSISFLCVLFLSRLNSLTTEKQTTKFSSANFKKNFKSKLYHIDKSRIQRLEYKQCSHLIKIYAVCKFSFFRHW